MDAWIEELLDTLAAQPAWGYRPGGVGYSEPTAMSALALIAHGRVETAEPQLRWLAERQSPNGSVGVGLKQSQPTWPTGLAVLAWRAAAVQTGEGESQAYDTHLAKGVDAILKAQGAAVPKSDQLGHDTNLVGWAWVDGTHSWIEPTAVNVLALKSTGHAEHARTREAVKLIIDRLLPEGGCNYGNTTVLGQVLRPHVQPTGLALMALAGETDESGRLAASITYLQGELKSNTPVASLAYGALACLAHDVAPADLARLLETAYHRLKAAPPDALRLALVALAVSGRQCPLIRLTQAAASQS